ncbi:sigma 54-interacting transcriptional regulator [Metabacillus sp. KIGAM252]|uniref:Sigma 54-interacting transcriptional regulator n=1 Tax=Metabacillus flavus TaxID=2823519 RepID=A0ABS5LFP7_9BACI|nr:sigma-54-dependent Fis family transcriptional regulator [Metabacillus flavus]MBS2969568.1 sigma 54-interacting transcriptional regulator [Metabacillus flavus]
MQKVLLVGAGKGGTVLLKMLIETKLMKVAAVADIDRKAPGIVYAREQGIPVNTNWKMLFTEDIDVVMEATGDPQIMEELLKARSSRTIVVPSTVALIIANLVRETEQLITRLKEQTGKYTTIFDSTNDGMIVIDANEDIILFNRVAENVTGHMRNQVLGKKIREVIPSTRLPEVLYSQESEYNQEQILDNGLKIITTRIPIMNEDGSLRGALSIFKDISDAVQLAEEITNLREIETMLTAIIQSSDEAISVVDEKGRGILVNPAYTRMTGLKEEDIIGLPATTDISEGESMHLRVLQTRRAVRGVRMKVGNSSKDVLVNVAPVIVDGKLKGSVGVIHDVSEIKKLTAELNRARQIIRTLEAKYTFLDIIGESEEMKLAIEQAKLGAKTPATVLLRGESGTGKELFAHAIHNESDRKYNKFIRVNCAAIAENLLESELFGYEEGAFSGAKRGGKTGFFEEANNGSIFLDEIGELSPQMQAKLLRVLQEKEIVRVGGTKPIPVNVRVIAATNIKIEKAMTEGAFREDLYYRLNRYPISIPPLRQRKGDIIPLCVHLIRKINQDYGKNIEEISSEAAQILHSHDWPGNVRELENILGRAMIFMLPSERCINAAHLPDFVSGKPAQSRAGIGLTQPEMTLSEAMERTEKDIIKATLQKFEYNRTRTAKSLGISLRSLYYKMEKYGIAKPGTQ